MRNSLRLRLTVYVDSRNILHRIQRRLRAPRNGGFYSSLSAVGCSFAAQSFRFRASSEVDFRGPSNTQGIRRMASGGRNSSFWKCRSHEICSPSNQKVQLLPSLSCFLFVYLNMNILLWIFSSYKVYFPAAGQLTPGTRLMPQANIYCDNIFITLSDIL